jgi:hypothetical protein
MKIKSLKSSVLASALAGFGLILIIATEAQQIPDKSISMTTDWTGSLVVGKSDPVDQIGPGLSPAVIHQVEIGLRSDGVVVWRTAGPNIKITP